MYQTHAPLHIFHHYLSDTRYLSDFPPQIKRRTLFIRSPTTIYQTHAPFHALHSHHYLHAFIARPHAPLFTRFSMSIHTLHTPLESGSNCVGHPTTSMWMATCTRHEQTRLSMCYKQHNMQTLSAVSCQRSAVSCRSFCARGHAFGTSPAFLKHHYLHAFSTTDTTSTTTTTTTTTHPITLYHTHTPSSMFHHYIHQTPAMYQIC